jgi:hypothetical protein
LLKEIADLLLLSDKFLCGSCEKVIKVMGQGEVTKEEKYYIL